MFQTAMETKVSIPSSEPTGWEWDRFLLRGWFLVFASRMPLESILSSLWSPYRTQDPLSPSRGLLGSKNTQAQFYGICISFPKGWDCFAKGGPFGWVAAKEGLKDHRRYVGKACEQSPTAS